MVRSVSGDVGDDRSRVREAIYDLIKEGGEFTFQDVATKLGISSRGVHYPKDLLNLISRGLDSAASAGLVEKLSEKRLIRKMPTAEEWMEGVSPRSERHPVYRSRRNG